MNTVEVRHEQVSAGDLDEVTTFERRRHAHECVERQASVEFEFSFESSIERDVIVVDVTV